MFTDSIIYPLILQVFLTFFLLFRMGVLRIRSILKHETKISQIALGQKNWPENINKAERAFANQLETPILFYLGVALVLSLQINDFVFTFLAWIFITFRLLHALEHSTRNHVPTRFLIFISAVLCLLAFWIYLSVKLILLK